MICLHCTLIAPDFVIRWHKKEARRTAPGVGLVPLVPSSLLRLFRCSRRRLLLLLVLVAAAAACPAAALLRRLLPLDALERLLVQVPGLLGD